jgi:hypothetical protein
MPADSRRRPLRFFLVRRQATERLGTVRGIGAENPALSRLDDCRRLRPTLTAKVAICRKSCGTKQSGNWISGENARLPQEPRSPASGFALNGVATVLYMPSLLGFQIGIRGRENFATEHGVKEICVIGSHETPPRGLPDLGIGRQNPVRFAETPQPHAFPRLGPHRRDHLNLVREARSQIRLEATWVTNRTLHNSQATALTMPGKSPPAHDPAWTTIGRGITFR